MTQATIHNTKAGSTVCVSGFDCIADETEVTICDSAEGLYFKCASGFHFLEGQLNDHDEYVGLTLVNHER